MKYFVAAYRWWRGLFNPLTILCWFIGALISGGAATIYFTTREPGTLLSISEDADFMFSNDGKLVLIVHTDKHRYCPADTYRWLDRPVVINGMNMPLFRYLGDIPSPPTPLGVQSFAVELDIPAPWDKIGTDYSSRTAYHCGIGQILEPQQTQVGPMPINVLPRQRPNPAEGGVGK